MCRSDAMGPPVGLGKGHVGPGPRADDTDWVRGT
jgi:hypothetical protein